MSSTRPDLASLSPEELSRRALERARQRKATAAGQTIPRRSTEGALPLSFAQERLWLIDRLDPGNVAFNLPLPARIRGRLEVAALAKSLAEVSRRQAALRTRFVEQGGLPLQTFDAPGKLPLPVVETSALGPATAQTKAERLVALEAALPFDFNGGLLWRRTLLRVSPKLHTLSVTMHHVISDGWSLLIFCRELSALYQGFASGQPVALPVPPIDFGDFVLWQRQRLNDTTLSAPMAYWKKTLAGAPPVLELPTDRPRPTVATNHGALATRLLSRELTAALDQMARTSGVTLFMLMLAAFKLLLGRLAGQDDVVVGAPSAGRSRTETEGLIGFFLNSLVLRTDLAGNPTVRQLLEREREVVLSAYQYQEVPFERLLAELQPQRLLSHAPIFQVQFNLLDQEPLALALGEAPVEFQPTNYEFVKFDLNLYVERVSAANGGGIELNLAYNRDLFDHDRMEEMLAQLESLLEQFLAHPEAPIGALTLRHSAAAQRLPDPSRPAQDGFAGTIHQRVFTHAASHPERIAVADEDETLTYGELAARLSNLAAWLVGSGLKPGDAVAIYAHRDADLPTTVLAALAAGGAFLLLDPSYPLGRLVDYLEIGRPRAFLALERAGEVPAEVHAALDRIGCVIRRTVLVSLGSVSFGLPEQIASGQAAAPEICAEDAACITFTSGSTGKPKAVVGRHGPLTFFQTEWAERFGLGFDHRFGMFSALSHDPLQRDLFTPLWLGGRLEVPGGRRIGTPGQMAPWLLERAVSVLHLTPAMMELVADDCATAAGESLELPDLRRAFVVGDLLKRSEVERLRAAAPRLRVVNLYGSTETQRSVATFEVPPPSGQVEREAVPLGRGLPGVDLVLLSRHGQPAGVGELAEITMRGRHLARGYLGDGRLTAERFVPNPFATSGEGGSGGSDRLYKTGDLGRYRPDGTVEFAGRADGQVKMRGFRIELGEIEAVLKRQPTVDSCAVVARRDGRGEMRLAAYLAPDSGLGKRELREALAQHLPDYMVPSIFVRLTALPMTKTGKIDRAALPAVESVAAERVGEAPEAFHRQAPRNPLEELVAGHWADLLGLEAVGIDEDFFALGGHSLLATRLLSRLRQDLGVELPLRTLFEGPTVAGLAAAVASAQAVDRPERPPVAVARPPGAPLELSFQQRRMWFLDQLEPGVTAYNLSAAATLSGRLEVATFAASFAAVTARHEALRSVFPAREGEATLVLNPPSAFHLPVVELCALVAEAREPVARRLAAREASRPFDLGHGPLFRAALLRLEHGFHALAFSLHHIVADGWSLAALLGELGAAYSAAVTGRAWAPAALPLQYPDFAAWQQGWLEGPALTRQLGYWREHLTGAPPELELPTDRPRPAERGYRGHRRVVVLDSHQAELVALAARSLGATSFMVLGAAYAAFLSRLSHQTDLVVGTPIAGRNDTRLEGLIGFFANTLPLRFSTRGAPPFHELVARVKEEVLSAFAHPDLPFERLVDELAPERSLARSPVFQVMFALQNTPPADLELPELTVAELPIELDKSPFDLTLTAMELGRSGLMLRLEAARDLFDGTSVARLLRGFTELLSSALATPARPITELTLLSAAERHQLLVEENDSSRALPAAERLEELPAAERLEELVFATALRRPDAVAVRFEGGELCYGELATRARELAHRLRALGVGPEVKVGFAADRSLGLLVGLLAVLDAGGAYVPLDPSHPQERLAWVLESSGIALLLGHPEALGRLPASAVPRFEIDGEGMPLGTGVVHATSAGRDAGTMGVDATSAGRDAGTVGVDATSAGRDARRYDGDGENLAYVLYTSGSTGKPKGVEVRHRAVVNFLASMAVAPGLAEGDVLVAVTTLSFDISVLELFLPLAVGATIELASQETAGDATRLAALIEQSGATVMQATPSTWRLLFEGGWQGRTGLKVLCGGEALPPDLARELVAKTAQLWNVYGPTETTVWSAVGRVQTAPITGRAVALGRVIDNTSMVLVDPDGRPVPRGISGELLIGGLGLARGYLGRPDLTAARFVPDPLAGALGGGAPGSRRYRTGDLVRRRADGALEYLGRIDAQVKVRGFRIELGEIEIALERQGTVAQAVAGVREDRPGERRLVAYVVPAPGAELDTAQLRRALGESLPDYMVPSLFVPMATLPLNSSGKVDRGALTRQALPQLDGEAGDFAAPEGPVEEILAAIWGEALVRPRIGRHDNFFDLGGDSILGIRIVARSADRGLRFAPRDLFRHQTVAELARAADATGLAEADGAGSLALTPGQTRLLAAASAGDTPPEMVPTVVVLTPPAHVGPETLAAALATLTQGLPALSARFTPGPGGPTARLLSTPAPIELERAVGGEEEALHQHLVARLDPAAGRLLAAAWVERPGHPARLWLAAHPLALDEASWAPLLAALAAAAEGLEPTVDSGGEALRAAHLQLRALGRAAVAPFERDSWVALSARPVPALTRTSEPAPGSTTLTVELSAAETTATGQVATRHGAELSEVVLAAVLKTLAGWAGSRRLAVEVAGDGAERRRLELDPTVVTALAPRVTAVLEVEDDALSTLEAVRTQARRARKLATLWGMAPEQAEWQPAQGAPRARIGFRFWETAAPRPGWKAAPRGRVEAELALLVTAWQEAGRLVITWSFDGERVSRREVDALAVGTLVTLRSMGSVAEPAAKAAVLAEQFPVAAMSSAELEDLLADL